MTNIAYQDIQGGAINIYSANPHLKKWDRINAALKELKHVGCIKIYIYKRRKLKLLTTKGY